MLPFNAFIDERQEQLLETLRGCIRFRSVHADDGSGYPYGLQNHLCLSYMLKMGESMGFASHDMDGYVGWCEYGEGEEMVVVLGHLDVVPEGEGWTVPPYEGVVKDGRFYGRGAIDDKGAMVSALYALQAVKESGLPLKRRIRLLFGLNEERGSADIGYYLKNGGEIPVMGFTPDGCYPVINGEKGIVMEYFTHALRPCGDIRLVGLWGGDATNIVPGSAGARLECSAEMALRIASMAEEKITCTPTDDGVLVEARGLTAHGSTPEDGENAIGRLMIFLNKLPLEGDLAEAVELLATKLGMECHGESLGIDISDELSGPLTMNMGVIAGDSEKIEVKLNYRYPVTCHIDQCGPAVRAAFEAAGFVQSAYMHKEQVYMSEDTPLVRKLMKVYREYTGDMQARPLSIGGGTYAKMMPNVLAFGPIFPGDEVREHQSDEYILVRRLLDCAKMSAAAMYEMASE